MREAGSEWICELLPQEANQDSCLGTLSDVHHSSENTCPQQPCGDRSVMFPGRATHGSVPAA